MYGDGVHTRARHLYLSQVCALLCPETLNRGSVWCDYSPSEAVYAAMRLLEPARMQIQALQDQAGAPPAPLHTPHLLIHLLLFCTPPHRMPRSLKYIGPRSAAFLTLTSALTLQRLS